MPTARPFAYNPSPNPPIEGTEQIGDLAIGVDPINYSGGAGGVRWWNGPDEDPGYVIAQPVPSGTQPNPDNTQAFVGFFRSSEKTEESFLSIANTIQAGATGEFTTGLQALTWLNENGYWTSYGTYSPNLLVYLDSGNLSSYPLTGSTWFDLSGNDNNATLFNSPTYSSDYQGILEFNDSYLKYGEIENLGNLNQWTVESWFRLSSSFTGKITAVVSNEYDLVNKLNFSIGTNNQPSNANLAVGFFDGNWRTTSGFTPEVDLWYQVVGTYDGSVVKQYVNGVQSGGTLNYTGTPQSGGGVRLMRRWDDSLTSSNFVNGDLAIVKIYDIPLTGSEILNNYNSTYERFLDPFVNPTLTTGSSVSTVSQSPFASGNSYSFVSNTNSFIDTPGSSSWAPGTGDFTIEWFSYQTSTSNFPRIFSVGSYSSASIAVSIEGGIFYYWANDIFIFSSSAGTVLNSWVHWAVVRQSGVTKVYKNGTQLGSQIADTNNITNSSTSLTIANETTKSTGASLVGYLTNFRWVDGVAVYTGNFTVPTSDLTAVAGANPYGGSNTQAIPTGATKLLLIP